MMELQSCKEKKNVYLECKKSSAARDKAKESYIKKVCLKDAVNSYSFYWFFPQGHLPSHISALDVRNTLTME